MRRVAGVRKELDCWDMGRVGSVVNVLLFAVGVVVDWGGGEVRLLEDCEGGRWG